MRSLLAFALLLWIGAQAASAEHREPTVYFFWVNGCHNCERAQIFFERARGGDPELYIRDLEVESSLANAIVFSRVYERIGMGGLGVVPLILVGPHVFIGFDDESGREILARIKDCRKKPCRDIVHDLIRQPSDLEQAAVSFIPPPECRSKPTTAIVSE
jgi:hypothetical protein